MSLGLNSRCYALVDQSAFLHNLKLIKQQVGAAKIMAMIKSNAYGHDFDMLKDLDLGLDLSNYITYFGVASVQEALIIKSYNLKNIKIVIMSGFCDSCELDIILQNDFEVIVHCSEQIALLQDIPKDQLSALNIWFKIDTGMHRLGFLPEEVISAYKDLDNTLGIKNINLMTHFACADDAKSLHMQQQLSSFNEVCNKLENLRNNKMLKSAANSGAIMNYPDALYDVVRPGLLLFGVRPVGRGLIDGLNLSNKNSWVKSLKPVMELRARVIAVKNIKKNKGVGYGQRWEAKKDTKIAVISIGYGDGYYRYAPDGTPVFINGDIAKLVGRVSMDSIMLDITDVKNTVSVGDEAVLWGKDLPIEQVAKAMDCSVYALLTGVSSRVKRCVANSSLSSSATTPCETTLMQPRA